MVIVTVPLIRGVLFIINELILFHVSHTIIAIIEPLIYFSK